MSYIENPHDPLHKPVAGPDRGRELFSAIGKVASGFTHDEVMAAAANMLVNAVRQKCASRRGAQDAFDEVMTRARALLLEQHYDMTGKRRSVFPFHQALDVPHFDMRRKQ